MKKFLTYSVVVATIVWSLGISAIMPAVAATLATYTPVAGDLVKSDGIGSAHGEVYYIASDLKAYLFSTRGTYASWYPDFSALKHIRQADFANISMGSNVTARAGANLVKFANSNTYYAVAPGAKLCAIANSAAAVALYGANYATKITDYVIGGLPSLLLSNYTIDSTCALNASSSLPNGTVFQYAGSAQTYYVQDGKKRAISTDAFNANMLRANMIITNVPTTMTYVDGLALTSMEAAIANPVSGTVAPPVTVGDLTVSLAADNPASVNIPGGSAFNPVLKVVLRAGAADVNVTSIKLKKSGYISNTNVTGIDVIDGTGKRHGNVASSINSDNEVNLLFSSDPIKVTAGNTVAVTIRVNILKTAISGTLQLGLAAASSIGCSATVGGSFPIWGNSMSIVDGSSAVAAVTLDVKPVNSTGVQYSIDANSEQNITKFNISETSNKEDILVNKITLYNNGNAADTDYKDVQLVDMTGNVLATAQPSGQSTVFDLSSNPYRITKGMNKDLAVNAKIVGGTTRTMQLTVYNDYDLEVKGADTGVSVLATAGVTDTSFPIGDATNYNLVNIGPGTLSFDKAIDSPSTATTPGSTGVVLAKFTAKAMGEDMELRQVKLAIATTSNYALTGSVNIKVDGASVWSGDASSISVNAGSLTSITLQSYPTLTAGKESSITIEGNVSSNATAADSYTATLDVTQVKRLATNDILDPSVSQQTGNIINVQSANLKVTTLSTPVAQTTVNGNNFTFASIELNANNSGENVKVSKIVFTDITTGSYGQISSLKLIKSGDTTEQQTSNNTSALDSTGKVSFNLVSPIVVTKVTPIVFNLVANISNATTGAQHTFKVAAAGDITASGATTGNTVIPSVVGNGQTMSLSTGGTASLSLISGSSASPSSDQLISVGTTDGVYYAVKISAQNEALKLRTIKLTATSTGGLLNLTDVTNIRLYTSLTGSPVATANQFDVCSAGQCSVTFTATDNILNTTIGTSPDTAVTLYVKANIGAAGSANLGDNFRFLIVSSTADVQVVGATSGNAASVSGNAAVTALTYIVPFTVNVAGVSPTSPQTAGTGVGTTIGVFKVTNNGSAAISLTKVKLTNLGSSTSTMAYKLYSSGDGGSQSDISVLATTTNGNYVDFGTLASALTIAGGSSRYLTIKTNAAAANNDTFQLSANQSVGDMVFTVSEANLGYNGNPSTNSNQTDLINNLGIVGNPSLETVTAKN